MAWCKVIGRRFPIWPWAFFACALMVLVLALMPSPPPMITTGWDKSNHLLAFIVMTWLGCKAFPHRIVCVMLGLLAYGVLIEILQSFTPNRSAEWQDLFSDFLGIVVGGAVYIVDWTLFRPIGR